MGTLRFILAAAVVVWHSGAIYGWRPFNGTACVNYFFVISGFYMALILTQKYVGPGRLPLFLSNRALRLWPFFAAVRFIPISLLIMVLRPLFLVGKSDDGSALVALRTVAILVGSVAVAYLMLRLIEQPIEKWRQRRIETRRILQADQPGGN